MVCVSFSGQSHEPPFGLCSDVTSDETACIGDDTVHAVFPGGYTWPNDPQTYVSDARAYRIIFAPGFIPATSPAITDAGPVPACASLPGPYGYATQQQVCSGVTGKLFAGAALSPACAKNDDCPVIPGSNPPARSSCDTQTNRCATWACLIAPGGPVSTGDILCSWSADDPTPSPTPTSVGGPPATRTGGPVATRTPGTEDDGCAITPNSGSSSGGILPALVAAVGALLRVRRRTPL